MFISVISPYFPYSIVVPLNFPFNESYKSSIPITIVWLKQKL